MAGFRQWLVITTLGLTSVFSAAAEDAKTLTPIEVDMYRNRSLSQFFEHPPKAGMTLVAPTLDADLFLEVASMGFFTPRTQELRRLPYAPLMVLVMPRLDLFQAHIDDLARQVGTVFVFFMDGAKAPLPYGDRSWDGFQKAGIFGKLPSNVKIFRLSDESITHVPGKNDLTYLTDTFGNSPAFRHQVNPIIKRTPLN